jgi:uncharacterized protein YeeX (DUF496 family)
MIWLIILAIIVGLSILRAIKRQNETQRWCAEFDQMGRDNKETICNNIYKYSKKGLNLKGIGQQIRLNEIEVSHVISSEFYKNAEKSNLLGHYPYDS